MQTTEPRIGSGSLFFDLLRDPQKGRTQVGEESVKYFSSNNEVQVRMPGLVLLHWGRNYKNGKILKTADPTLTNIPMV